MKKFITFSYVFRKSLFSLSYYRDVLKSRFKFSIKYFLAFSFLLGFLSILSISLSILPQVNIFLERFKNRAYTVYPSDLVITLKNGELSTNVTEPFHIPFPYELFSQNVPSISDQQQTYLMTIDTKANAQDFTKSQSLILVTHDKYVFASENTNGIHEESLKNLGDMTIDKKFFDQKLNSLLPLLKYADAFLITIILITFIIIIPIIRLASLFIYTLILLIPAKIMGLNIKFTKLYQIGLHSLTLPLILQMALFAFAVNPTIPFFGSIVFLLYNLVILAELNKTKV
jgi:hypothetical protein